MTKAKAKGNSPGRAAFAGAHSDWWRIRGAGGRPLAQDGAEDTAEILIFGDIGPDWFGEESTSALSLVEALNELPPNIRQIVVRINSYGGKVSDGLAIYNALQRHAATVTTSVEGVAVSIASLIAMAGETIQMAQNSLMMIHAPWAMSIGNSRDMRAAADILDTYAESMASSYARASGRSHDDVLALLTDGEDHWYTAAQAVDEGFAHEITDDLAVAAMWRLDNRFSVPAGLAAQPESPLTPPEEPTMTRKRQNDPNDPNDPNHSGSGEPAPAATPQGGGTDPQHQPGTGGNGGGEPAPAPAAGGNPQPAGNVAQLDTTQMRARNDEIRTAFAAFASNSEVNELMVECLTDPDITADQARARLLNKMGEGAEPATPAGHAPRISVGQTESERARAGMRDAVLARAGVVQQDPANEYRGMRLTDLARASLERAGVNTRGMTPYEVAQAVVGAGQTTSDFPVILEDTINRIVLGGFDAQPDTWSRFCRSGDVSDFRAAKRLRTGVIGNLNEVNEAGEYQNKQMPDAKAESIAARRRGAIIQITPEVLVNDDLGEIQRMADGLGRSADRTIESGVYKVLNSNPKLADGTALFHANHNNLAGIGAAPSVEALDAGRQAMAQQKDVSGEEYLDIRPAVAVVPVSLGGTMRVLVNAEFDPDATGQLRRPNKVNGLVQDIVDSPRVDGPAWYLFADPMVAPVIEVAFLEGQRQPRIVQEENFRTGGLAWRVELPFGVAPIDFRGAWKNPGNSG